MQAGAALLALAACRWWWRRYRQREIGPVLLKVVGAAVVAGRLGFILGHRDFYAGAPLAMLALDDGGFVASAAAFAAFAVATECTRQRAMLRQPLAIALASAAAAWGAMALVLAQVTGGAMTLPAVAVTQLDGKAAQLTGLPGQPVVLNLWASWCPPCRREMPTLADAQRRHPGTRMVFVNQGEDAATIRAFLDQQGLVLENVYVDRLSKLSQASDAVGLPTTLFFDRKGVLVSRHVGALSAPVLAAELAKLDGAQAVAPPPPPGTPP